MGVLRITSDGDDQRIFLVRVVIQDVFLEIEVFLGVSGVVKMTTR